ncbi:hypothetical protein DFP73DRAFT_563287 [Morchella snyderi]|nr:hypothetical protein DFP73DRAFT_563287 [Morchella snyderi]
MYLPLLAVLAPIIVSPPPVYFLHFTHIHIRFGIRTATIRSTHAQLLINCSNIQLSNALTAGLLVLNLPFLII